MSTSQTRPTPGFDPETGTTQRLAARDLIWWLLDSPVFLPAVGGAPDPLDWPGYDSARRTAQSEVGSDESVTVARGRVPDARGEVVLIAWDFAFLGGSMGVTTGESIARGYEYATRERLPVVLFTATGGARMQEGMAALVQMAKTTLAASRHADAGLFQLAILSDPTTGGVFASHANLADVLVAEAGATIGFAGPRVAATLTGSELPAGSHTTEHAAEHGLIDGVTTRDQLPDLLARVARWLAPAVPVRLDVPDGPRVAVGTAWEAVQGSRDPQRPTAAHHIAAMEPCLELRGDRAGNDDPAIRVVLSRPGGRPCVVIGIDRAGNGGRVNAAGYRKALRGIHLAQRLGVPVVTLIDTPGADASAAGEAGGIAHHIAITLQALLTTSSPTVAVVVGEGGSGGALALAVADRLLIQEHATFSIIAPSAAAAILHRDAGRADELAEQLDPTAQRLVAMGIAHAVIPEPTGQASHALVAAVAEALDVLAGQRPAARLKARARHWRHAGDRA